MRAMAIVGDAGRVEVRLQWGGSSRSKMRPVRVLRDRQEPFSVGAGALEPLD